MRIVRLQFAKCTVEFMVNVGESRPDRWGTELRRICRCLDGGEELRAI